MSSLRTLRTLRQKRLREVGEAGQATIFAASARVHHEGLRGEFAIRYLVGAGVSRIAAPESLHASALALDPDVELAAAAAATAQQVPSTAEGVPEAMTDPEARAAFAGALEALQVLRSLLELAP